MQRTNQPEENEKVFECETRLKRKGKGVRTTVSLATRAKPEGKKNQVWRSGDLATRMNPGLKI